MSCRTRGGGGGRDEWARGTNLRFVDVEVFHVHRVDGREDVGRALHDALARLRQYDGRAGGEEDRLVAVAQGDERQVVAFHEHDLVSKGGKKTNWVWYNVDGLVFDCRFI